MNKSIQSMISESIIIGESMGISLPTHYQDNVNYYKNIKMYGKI